MDLGLAGRVALVCGSTQGLGRAVAKALGHEGARVAINGRHADSVARAAQQLSSETGQVVLPFAADVGDGAEAAGLVSSPPLRNAGTIGGNLCVDTRCNYYDMTYEWRKAAGFCMKKDGDICLVAPSSPRCWAVSSSDTAPMAIALDGIVMLTGPDGERELPVSALYRDDGIDYMAKQPNEVVTSLRLSADKNTRSAYVKLRRRGFARNPPESRNCFV